MLLVPQFAWSSSGSSEPCLEEHSTSCLTGRQGSLAFFLEGSARLLEPCRVTLGSWSQGWGILGIGSLLPLPA